MLQCAEAINVPGMVICTVALPDSAVWSGVPVFDVHTS